MFSFSPQPRWHQLIYIAIGLILMSLILDLFEATFHTPRWLGNTTYTVATVWWIVFVHRNVLH